VLVVFHSTDLSSSHRSPKSLARANAVDQNGTCKDMPDPKDDAVSPMLLRFLKEDKKAQYYTGLQDNEAACHACPRGKL
jgi:hypothetical protein